MTFLDRLKQFLRGIWREVESSPAIAAAPPPAIPPLVVPSGCIWCNESLLDGPIHPVMQRAHMECALRLAAGSIAHVERRCGCFVAGATDHDPPGLSRRDAARLVYRRIMFGKNPPN